MMYRPSGVHLLVLLMMPTVLAAIEFVVGASLALPGGAVLVVAGC